MYTASALNIKPPKIRSIAALIVLAQNEEEAVLSRDDILEAWQAYNGLKRYFTRTLSIARGVPEEQAPYYRRALVSALSRLIEFGNAVAGDTAILRSPEFLRFYESVSNVFNNIDTYLQSGEDIQNLASWILDLIEFTDTLMAYVEQKYPTPAEIREQEQEVEELERERLRLVGPEEEEAAPPTPGEEFETGREVLEREVQQYIQGPRAPEEAPEALEEAPEEAFEVTGPSPEEMEEAFNQLLTALDKGLYDPVALGSFLSVVTPQSLSYLLQGTPLEKPITSLEVERAKTPAQQKELEQRRRTPQNIWRALTRLDPEALSERLRNVQEGTFEVPEETINLDLLPPPPPPPLPEDASSIIKLPEDPLVTYNPSFNQYLSRFYQLAPWATALTSPETGVPEELAQTLLPISYYLRYYRKYRPLAQEIVSLVNGLREGGLDRDEELDALAKVFDELTQIAGEKDLVTPAVPQLTERPDNPILENVYFLESSWPAFLEDPTNQQEVLFGLDNIRTALETLRDQDPNPLRVRSIQDSIQRVEDIEEQVRRADPERAGAAFNAYRALLPDLVDVASQTELITSELPPVFVGGVQGAPADVVQTLLDREALVISGTPDNPKLVTVPGLLDRAFEVVSSDQPVEGGPIFVTVQPMEDFVPPVIRKLDNFITTDIATYQPFLSRDRITPNLRRFLAENGANVSPAARVEIVRPHSAEAPGIWVIWDPVSGYRVEVHRTRTETGEPALRFIPVQHAVVPEFTGAEETAVPGFSRAYYITDIVNAPLEDYEGRRVFPFEEDEYGNLRVFDTEGNIYAVVDRSTLPGGATALRVSLEAQSDSTTAPGLPLDLPDLAALSNNDPKAFSAQLREALEEAGVDFTQPVRLRTLYPRTTWELTSGDRLYRLFLSYSMDPGGKPYLYIQEAAEPVAVEEAPAAEEAAEEPGWELGALESAVDLLGNRVIVAPTFEEAVIAAVDPASRQVIAYVPSEKGLFYLEPSREGYTLSTRVANADVINPEFWSSYVYSPALSATIRRLTQRPLPPGPGFLGRIINVYTAPGRTEPATLEAVDLHGKPALIRTLDGRIQPIQEGEWTWDENTNSWALNIVAGLSDLTTEEVVTSSPELLDWFRRPEEAAPEEAPEAASLKEELWPSLDREQVQEALSLLRQQVKVEREDGNFEDATVVAVDPKSDRLIAYLPSERGFFYITPAAEEGIYQQGERLQNELLDRDFWQPFVYSPSTAATIGKITGEPLPPNAGFLGKGVRFEDPDGGVSTVVIEALDAQGRPLVVSREGRILPHTVEDIYWDEENKVWVLRGGNMPPFKVDPRDLIAADPSVIDSLRSWRAREQPREVAPEVEYLLEALDLPEEERARAAALIEVLRQLVEFEPSLNMDALVRDVLSLLDPRVETTLQDKRTFLSFLYRELHPEDRKDLQETERIMQLLDQASELLDVAPTRNWLGRPFGSSALGIEGVVTNGEFAGEAVVVDSVDEDGKPLRLRSKETAELLPYPVDEYYKQGGVYYFTVNEGVTLGTEEDTTLTERLLPVLDLSEEEAVQAQTILSLVQGLADIGLTPEQVSVVADRLRDILDPAVTVSDEDKLDLIRYILQSLQPALRRPEESQTIVTLTDQLTELLGLPEIPPAPPIEVPEAVPPAAPEITLPTSSEEVLQRMRELEERMAEALENPNVTEEELNEIVRTYQELATQLQALRAQSISRRALRYISLGV